MKGAVDFLAACRGDTPPQTTRLPSFGWSALLHSGGRRDAGTRCSTRRAGRVLRLHALPMQLDRLITAAGGAITTAELHRAGITRSALDRLLRRGQLWRARQGWYVSSGTAIPVLHAVRVGGVLTCARALEAHRLWSIADRGVHVRVQHSACRLRTSHDFRQRLAEHPDPAVTTHWSPDSTDSSRLVAGPLDALDDYFACVERDVALGSLDSMIRSDPARASALRRRFGVGDREGVDGGCESGIETVFFVRMLRLGLAPRRQILLPGVGRVDFLLGDRLVVEVDGRRFHDVESQFEKDRTRDAHVSASGRRALRFSHDQVLERWTEVERAVLASVARGDHL